MRKVIGWMLLAAPLVAATALHVRDHGWEDVLYVLAVVLACASMVGGFLLVMGSEQSSRGESR